MAMTVTISESALRSLLFWCFVEMHNTRRRQHMEGCPGELVRGERRRLELLSAQIGKAEATAEPLTRRLWWSLPRCICFSAGFDGRHKGNNRKTPEAERGCHNYRKRKLNP